MKMKRAINGTVSLNFKFSKILFVLVPLLFAFMPFAHSQDPYTDSLKAVIKSTKIDTLKVLALDDLCYYYIYRDPNQAKTYGQEALELAKKISYNNGLSRVLSDVGTYFAVVGQTDSALYYYRQALKIRKQIGNKAYIANALSNIGFVFDQISNYDSALSYHLDALKMRELIKDDNAIANSLMNIGIIYFRLSNFKEANSYYLRALKIRESLSDSLGIANLYTKIAETFNESASKIRNDSIAKYEGKSFLDLEKNYFPTQNEKKLYDSSLFYYKRALNIFESFTHKRNLSLVYGNMGNIYGSLRDFTKAKDFLQRSLAIQQEIGDKSGEMHSYYNLAVINLRNELTNEALVNYKNCLKIAYEVGDRAMQQQIYLDLSSLYSSINDFENAYLYYTRHAKLKDSIFNERMSEQVAEMQTKYDLEKKEGQLKLIRQEQEASKARQRLYLIGGAIIILLLLIIVVVISNAYRSKQKANILLRQQKEQILIQNEELKHQKEEIEAQRDEIEKQRNQIEEKNKHITDSIRYAMRIQHAILPSDDFIRERLKDFFVYFQPKDIVSGDFYWVDTAPDGSILFAAVDCTGHGVPGAFVSIVGSNLLNAAVHEDKLIQPAEILNYLSNGVNATLQKDDDKKVKDGMDLCLCRIDFVNMKLQYAGVHNPMVRVRDGVAEQFEVDTNPIGSLFTEKFPSYTNYELDVLKGDTFYVFSDGFQDQFGGPDGKKYMKKRLREKFANMSPLTMDEQRKELTNEFETWKKVGNRTQLDDVIIFGVRI